MGRGFEEGDGRIRGQARSVAGLWCYKSFRMRTRAYFGSTLFSGGTRRPSSGNRSAHLRWTAQMC